MQITGLFDKMKNVFEKVVKILPAKVAMSQRDMKVSDKQKKMSIVKQTNAILYVTLFARLHFAERGDRGYQALLPGRAVRDRHTLRRLRGSVW